MMDWWNQAACRNRDSDQFFPIGTAPAAQRQVAAAKQVCSTCPVRNPCLIWALETGTDHGVWGGLTEDERRTLKRRDARQRARTDTLVPAAAPK